MNPQPTTTHTESGTEHAPADPVVAAEMSTSDTPAEVSTEATPATEVSATVATGDAEPTPADKPVAKEVSCCCGKSQILIRLRRPRR